MTTRWFARLLAAVLVVAAVVAAGGSRRTGRPNVVLVLIDTLRADHVSGYGYPRKTTPRLDRLIADGVRFDAAFSTSSWSVPAHVSLLTGVLPERHGAFDFGGRVRPEIPTLAEVLRDRGYETGIFSAHAGLYFSVGGVADGFHHRRVVPASLEEELPEAAVRWVTERRGPFFAYVVLMTPHAPYDRYPAAYDRKFTDVPPGGERRLPFVQRSWSSESGIPRRVRIDERDDIGFYVNRYDRAVHHADVLLARILEGLERAGALENTIVVVTSDHGEELGEHGTISHEFSLYDTLVRVPLVFSFPSVIPRGRRWDGPVQIADVVPTVLALVGVTPPVVLDGSDLSEYLRGGASPDRERVITAAYVRRWYRRFMVRLPCLKLVYDAETREEELYDPCVDPEEAHPLAPPELDSRSPSLHAMRERMAVLVSSYPERAPIPSREELDRVRQELTALGYLDAAAGP